MNDKLFCIFHFGNSIGFDWNIRELTADEIESEANDYEVDVEVYAFFSKEEADSFKEQTLSETRG